MTVSLVKGENVNLTKDNPALNKVFVGLSWNPRKTSGIDFDLDAQVFLLNENSRVRTDADFIFYSNKSSLDGSVKHGGDNRTGVGEGFDETVNIELNKIPADVKKVVFTASIYDALNRKQNFGQVDDASITILDETTGQALAKFDLTEDASADASMILGELYRHNNEWKFKAVGQGFKTELGDLAKNFGVDVG